MPTNEEGEFELVLGNRQLLSVFFIVTVLLGLFFMMGYIVGRNTMPGGTEMASSKGAPMVVDPPAAAPPAASPGSGGGERPSPSPTPAPPVTATQPPAQTAAPPKVEPAPAKPEPPKPEPVKTEPPKPEPAKPAPVKPAPPPVPPKVEPPKPAPAAGGSYLQVAATRKPEADLLAEVLTKKGYPTVVTPVPDSAMVRVLVGPLSSDVVNTTREALQAAGFKPFPRAKL